MITLSEVRTQVNSTAESEGPLDLIRQGVIARWERETSLLWAARDEYVFRWLANRPDRQVIYLPLVNLAPASLEVIERRKGLLSDDTTELETPEDYSLEYVGEWNRGVAPELHRIGCYWGVAVTIEMSGGFTAANCPFEIKRALLLQVHFEFQRWQEAALSIDSRSIGQSSAMYLSGDLHPTFNELAKRYAASMVG